MAAWLAFGPVARADEVPAQLPEAGVLLRALGYDRSLAREDAAELVVLVLYRRGNAESERQQREIEAALAQAASDTSVQARPVRVRAVAWAGRDALAREASAAGVEVVWVCGGLESQAEAISGVTRETGALSATGGRALVEQRLALGVVRDEDGKARVVVNLAAAEAEGARFSSELLALAEVIR